MSQPWYTEAACVGKHKLIDAAEDGDFEARVEAKSLCSRCPVRMACVMDAVETGDWQQWRGAVGKQRLHQMVDDHAAGKRVRVPLANPIQRPKGRTERLSYEDHMRAAS